MSNYYDGLNLKLLRAISPGARKILELGCANGKLGRRYKEFNPQSEWIGVDIHAEAVAEASRYLDRAHQLDLNKADLQSLGRGFDVIVMGDLLEHLQSPEQLLNQLYDIAHPDAALVCCLPNMAHISVLEKMIAGDISYEDMGLLDRTHTRFFSPSSAFKTFLDSGWLPHMHDQYDAPAAGGEFLNHVLNAAHSLGIPEKTAQRRFNLYQMIIKAKKWHMSALRQPGPMVNFSVIVPVNRPWQYKLNILASPGLKEVNAEIIPIQNAQNAAHAYEIGASVAKNEWRLLVHQDVYFPTGTGLTIARELGKLSQALDVENPVGFAGLATRDGQANVPAGLVLDRTHLFDHAASNQASSLDEFAIALHKNARVKIDPELGWHLWATDLCLQARGRNHQHTAKILSAPLFHNSSNDYELPPQFKESAQILLAKHSHLPRITTLCGAITAERPEKEFI